MWHIALKVPGGAVPVGRLAKRHNAGFPRAEVLNDAFDRPILSGRVTSLEYDQHLVLVLDDVPLNLDELNLEIAQCLLVSRGSDLPTMCLRGLRHFGSRSLSLAGNGRLSEYLWAFSTTFVPHDDVNQVKGPEAG